MSDITEKQRAAINSQWNEVIKKQGSNKNIVYQYPNKESSFRTFFRFVLHVVNLILSLIGLCTVLLILYLLYGDRLNSFLSQVIH